MGKQSIRRKMLEQLRQLPLAEKQRLETNMHQHLFQSKYWEKAVTVGITYSTAVEWDTTAVMDHAWKIGKRIALPKSDPRRHHLQFYEVEHQDQLEPGYANIIEPLPSKSKWLHKTDLDLIIVPGIVFDYEGYRIGFGGGYYDRFLVDYEGTSVSLAATFQLTERLIHDEYDIPVQCIITEREENIV